MQIRPMTIDDYEVAYALWNASLASRRDESDTREGVAAFLRRNPGLSVVAVDGAGTLAGSILCGHDGRRGSLYHVTVAETQRKQGVGKAMVEACLAGLAAQGITKCALVAFTDNQGGNAFWARLGFQARADLFYRETALRPEPGQNAEALGAR